MFLFGYNLSAANLMDLYHPDDIYQVCVGPKDLSSFEIPIVSASIGVDTSNPNTFNSELDAWLRRHSVAYFGHFIHQLEGRLDITPFFPIEAPTTIKASAVIASIYPPTEDQPNHFGILRIVSGKLSGENVAFEPSDLYIHGFNMGACKDISEILYADAKVLLDVRPALLSEATRWSAVLANCCDDDGNPLRIQTLHVTSLAFIGQRPNKSLSAKINFTAQDVLANGDAVRWLKSAGLPISTFVSAESSSKEALPEMLEPRTIVEPQLVPRLAPQLEPQLEPKVVRQVQPRFEPKLAATSVSVRSRVEPSVSRDPQVIML
jgi:hypothetical protein